MPDTDHKRMLEWAELPVDVLGVMRELGNFSPTVHAGNREVKGYMLDSEGEGGKVYWSSADLRHTASACTQVADWLDARAAAAIGEQMP